MSCDCNYDYIIKKLLTEFVKKYRYHRIVKYIYLIIYENIQYVNFYNYKNLIIDFKA